MSDLRQWSHEFFTEFVELYRSYPCLWQVKSKDYSNRDKKNEAYAVLVKKCQEVDRGATKDTVAKNQLLSFSFSQRVTKSKKSACSGAGVDDLYKRSFWYFSSSFIPE
jgi:hypothetical protein